MLERKLGLSRITAHLLVSRGIDTLDAARDFLEPCLERDWHDPLSIPGMVEASDEIECTLRAKGRVVIFGDFDVDGITSTAVLTRGLRELGATVVPLIPHRLEEGYGLSEAALQRIFDQSPDLVVTVDNGVSSVVEVGIMRARGLRVVITDHHEPGDLVPVGVPVVDPKLDKKCPSRELAGVGVALKLVQELGRRLGKPDLWRDFTDLAALGTVADQMLLVGENRALVADGIARMNSNPCPAIAAFIATSHRGGPLSSDGLSYSLIPRLNSAGRMGDAARALELLLSDDFDKALGHMAQLEEINAARRQAELEFTELALCAIKESYRGEKAIVLGGENWHEGIKGIVASRIANRFGAPTILFSIIGDLAHGSGRSVGSVNLYKAVERCADLFVRFGGHEAAVGITLRSEHLPEFRARFCALMNELPSEQFIPAAKVDMEVTLGEITLPVLEELECLAPFGQGNHVPCFIARSVLMTNSSKLGNPPAHLSCFATDGLASVRGIYFNPPDLDELAACQSVVDMVFLAEKNEFRGKSTPQLMLKDIRICARAEGENEDDFVYDEVVEDLFSHSDRFLDKGDYAGILDADSFHTKLAGVTFDGRQQALSKMGNGAELVLRREPENEYDSCAVAVFHVEEHIGYLNTRLAQRLAPAIDAGVSYEAMLTELTGGVDDTSYGANIIIRKVHAAEEDIKKAARLSRRKAEMQALGEPELSERIREVLIGEHSLHDAQKESLDYLAQGHAVLAVMATGRGKSLIFHMHAARCALRDKKASVFIYPLRALVADQAFHLQGTFEELGLQACLLTGESSEEERTRVFAGLEDGSVDCVLTTPEFLSLHAARFAQTGRIGFLVVDEAHHIGMARAGHRPAYAGLAEVCHALGNPPTLATTATADDATAREIVKALGIDKVVLDPTVRENLRIEDARSVRDRDMRLAHLVSSGEKSVVYVNSREHSIRLARMLRKRIPDQANGIAFYNAGLSRKDRAHVEQAFRTGALRTIVSTSAFGEGVNIPDIRHVVLYHLPFNDVEFNQMAGRAGRDGAPAHIHLLFGKGDAKINEKILSSAAPARGDLITLYRCLRALQADLAGDDGFFMQTNEDIAQRCVRIDPKCALTDQGVSCGISIFKELSLLETRGQGSARRIKLLEGSQKVELSTSVRYLEGCDELEQFEGFRDWVFEESSDMLLMHFNRPIIPYTIG
ncbi:MAG: single-stranded-DNA-specific exonuclease RecJ [Actinobacteria bacterium]|nr:single-stranded-DNA-specific exonuclease RecJ [Actinomycetota bacterium]